MMKKVGLMTCYMNNFGACLQAYALQHKIDELGLDCEIIKYTPIRAVKEYSFLIKVGRRLYSLIKGFANIDFRYENYRNRSFVRFRKKYLTFSNENYLKEEELYSHQLKYDCYVTGSDQIWNPNLFNGQANPIYFLDFVPDGKGRVAYAPSIGVSSVSDSYKTEMKKYLARFDAISVREYEGKEIIDSIIECECRAVLDPTLLLKKNEWEALLHDKIINKDYILLYLFSDREYIGEFVQYVQEQLGIDVVTIPFNKREYYSNHIKIKKAGPLEFLNLIKNASLVITDSFHATAFSINLQVPFYTLLRNTEKETNNMNSRIYSILSFTKLENRIIRDKEAFPDKINLEIDFSEADKRLQEKREQDIDFLKSALGAKK